MRERAFAHAVLVIAILRAEPLFALARLLGRNAEDFAISTSGSENIHEQFKCGCLTRPVGAHKSIDRTFRDLEVQPIQGLDTAESLQEISSRPIKLSKRT